MISFRGLTKSMRGRDGFERYSRPDDAVLIANFAMALRTNFIEKDRCAAASSYAIPFATREITCCYWDGGPRCNASRISFLKWTAALRIGA